MKPPISIEALNGQIARFKAAENDYIALVDFLVEKLKTDLKPLRIEVNITGRVKRPASFAEKVLRKPYDDPITQMPDLGGVRAITHTKEDARRVCNYIKKHFFLVEVEEKPGGARKMSAREFGYRAVHFVVKLNDPPEERFRGKQVEIQVRTIPEHCWAEIGHDRVYKSGFKVPERWDRAAAAIAAMLEKIDEAFTHLFEGLSAYQAAYGRAHRSDEIEQELGILQTLMDLDREHPDEDLVHQAARLHLQRGQWDDASGLIRAYETAAAAKECPGASARLLLCAGIAFCQKAKESCDPQHTETAIGFLQRAYEADCKDALMGARRDVEIVVSLADALVSRAKGDDAGHIGPLYDEAFALDPGHPRVVIGQLQYRSGNARRPIQDLGFLEPLLERPIRRCLDQIEVQVNLPWAYYNLGELYLLGGKTYKCLNAYAKAITCSEKPFMIEGALDSLERHSRTKSLEVLLPLARKLLLLGLWSKAGEKRPKNQLKRVRSTEFRKPVIIVAGGCDPQIEAQLQGHYQNLFEEVFKGFDGTIISGGTTSGVAGLVGSVAKQKGSKIEAVTYAPKNPPNMVDKSAYTVHEIGETTFGPEQPLQNWIDLFSAEVKPSEVRLLGVNGGELASFEYQLALALGVTVGLIEDSGRAADTVLMDLEWQQPREGVHRLVRLHNDSKTVRSYLRPAGPPPITPSKRDLLAETLHEFWMRGELAKLKTAKDTLKPWSVLQPKQKQSNLQAIDAIFEHIPAIGFEIVKLADVDRSEPLTADDIDELAQLEHGRWYVDKLSEGWNFAEKRDDGEKLHPAVRPWADLREDYKETTRQAAARIPELLVKIGLGLRRVAPAGATG